MGRQKVIRKLGDACPKCKRTDVEFYDHTMSRCKNCRSESAASYYKERYWRDPEWRDKQIKDAKARQDLKFDTCLCGKPKQIKSNLCKDCWEKPLETCIVCDRPRDDKFQSNKCYQCTLDLQRTNRKQPEYKSKAYSYQRARWLYQKYGLTLNDYNELLESQNHKCAICSSHEWGPKGPQVDHDHSMSGKESVRGILCSGCNWALGKFGDTLDSLRSAVAYLERFESKTK